MSFDQAQATCAFAASLALVLCTLICQRRFGYEDIGRAFVAFSAGSALPKAILLSLYAFYPDPPSVMTKLHHHEIYVSAAGLSLFLSSMNALGALFLNAVVSVGRPDGASEISSDSSESLPPTK